MLSVDHLTVAYGGVRAVDHVSLQVEESTVVGLIGPNGAGKSTAINAITGVVAPMTGSVHLDGRNLVGATPQEVLRAGLSRTFQQAQLWGGMTVAQNIAMPLLTTGRGREVERRVAEVAEMLSIGAALHHHPNELPYGMRRLVEVGRAVVTDPKVVLLDEPGAGLTRGEKARLVEVLRRLATAGTSVLLVDHDMELVMTSCSKVVVLDAGVVIATGTPQEIRDDPHVVAVYLGTEAA